MKIHFQQSDNQSEEIEVIVQASQLTSEVTKLLQYLENWQQTYELLPITIDERVFLLNISDIIAFEVLSNDLTIYTIQETYNTKGVLKKMFARLPDGFIQVSKNSVINIKYLQSMEASFSGNMVAYMDKNIKIIVSRKYLSLLKEALGM